LIFLNTKVGHAESSKEEIGASTGETRVGGIGVPLLRTEDRQLLAGLGGFMMTTPRYPCAMLLWFVHPMPMSMPEFDP